MDRCRVGLIGAGNVARRHARVLSGFPDVELVGVTDVLPDACRRLADHYAAPVYPDVPALLDSGPDAVYVCVPPFAHGPAEQAVVAAGLPMFVEKPLATDLATAEEIARLVASRAVRTAVGHHWRYLPVLERARELLADRPVRLINGAWLDRAPAVSWWGRRDLSGGPVLEQAVHLLDLMRVLAGEVVEVAGYANGVPPPVDGADVDSVTSVTLRFAGGAVGTLVSACVLGWRHRAGLEIVADGLVLTLDEDGLRWRDPDRVRRLPADPAATRTAVDRAFVDAVRGVGDDVRVPYPEALRTHRLACAVARSAAAGRPVRLAPVAEAVVTGTGAGANG